MTQVVFGLFGLVYILIICSSPVLHSPPTLWELKVTLKVFPIKKCIPLPLPLPFSLFFCFVFFCSFLANSHIPDRLVPPTCVAAWPPDSLVGHTHNRALPIGRLTWLTSVCLIARGAWPRPLQYNATVSVPDSSGPERYVPLRYSNLQVISALLLPISKLF